MPLPPVVLHAFQAHLPGHAGTQDEILDWLAAAHARAAGDGDEGRYRRLVRRFGCGPDRIEARRAYLEDFRHRDWPRMRIFDLDRHPAGSPCGERMAFFSETAERILADLYAGEEAGPGTLVHVTCTGYASPSAAQRLVAARGWDAEVLHAYHMGCYASLPAVRAAAGRLALGAHRVDLVHTELCTLHMDPSRHDPETLVTQTLFADGAVRYRAAANLGRPGLAVLATREEIVPGTGDAMTWVVSEAGMRMTLSRRVPELIRAALPDFLARLARDAGLDREALVARARFAIHPGGPRIIDGIRDLLGLDPLQVEASNRVLRARGNMSSATLPHVWMDLLEDPDVPSGTPVAALAFGPGLTLAGAVLRKDA